jgi:Uma2 family endonuclease
MSQAARRGTSIDDFWAIPETERFHEFYAGELVEKATPSGEHGGAQVSIAAAIAGPFQRKPSSGGPGGWWLASEVEVLLHGEHVVRPDVLGWRREHCPSRPTGTPVTVRPDWICEILSPSNANRDTVKKLRLYQEVAIPHYWIVDPRDATLTVMRHSAEGYIMLLRAERHEVVHAEPFEAIEIAVGTFFGDEPPG